MRRRKRRDTAVFGMSFLDCVSCGFGAAILLFMLVDHARIDRDLTQNSELIARVNALENRLLDDSQAVLLLREALDDDEEAKELASKQAERLREQIEQLKSELPEAEDSATSRDARLKKLQQELLALESRVKKARAASQDPSGDATRNIAGEGRRQYLQGLGVHGDYVLILVDASASMLADSIVDVLRLRNMSQARQNRARKWRQTVAAADWISARVEPGWRFQMAAFNEQLIPLTENSGAWLPVGNGNSLNQAMKKLRTLTPAGGTNLGKAMAYAASLSPRPDNVYLITDGLPTQGGGQNSGNVSGRQRAGLFDQAIKLIPRNTAINTVLLPMEGDPRAASAYWALAMETNGALLEPSADWP